MPTQPLPPLLALTVEVLIPPLPTPDVQLGLGIRLHCAYKVEVELTVTGEPAA